MKEKIIRLPNWMFKVPYSIYYCFDKEKRPLRAIDIQKISQKSGYEAITYSSITTTLNSVPKHLIRIVKGRVKGNCKYFELNKRGYEVARKMVEITREFEELK